MKLGDPNIHKLWLATCEHKTKAGDTYITSNLWIVAKTARAAYNKAYAFLRRDWGHIRVISVVQDGTVDVF